ncbi:MAG: imelysin family protein [Deltaproteobacteria bacterium]|nr:imelysin family protein [Deltaproteobacteria bacterium]
MNRIAWLTVATSLSAIVTVVACRRAPPQDEGASSSGVASSSGASTGSSSTSGATSGGPGGFDKLALLRAVADCTLARARHFDGAAKALRDASAAFAADRSAANADARKAAWSSAMASWQEVEIFRFGPSASSTQPGGADLRDQIYAYPLFNRCKVDEQTVAKTYETPAFATSLIFARGLGSFEYLAFYAGSDNACAAGAPLNAGGAWAALGPDELAARKAGYARAIGDDVAAKAAALVTAWDPASGNFHAALSQPGSPKSPYKAVRDALNAVSDGMFYIEREVKDVKLARPLGVSPDCATTRCPELVESPHMKTSNAHLAANLVGFRRIFEGCADDGAGLGFDDWLRAVGQGALADRMLAALADARAAVAALDLPLEEAITRSPAKADLVYAAVKALTDLMKTDFVTVLDLDLPKQSEGDND